MQTKRHLRETIQDRLGAAGAPADIRKFYPSQIIDQFIGKVYSDLAQQKPKVLQDMALEYDLTLSNTGNTFYSTLPVKPIGSFGILWVEGNGIFIPTDQGGMEAKILKKVEPGRIPGCRLVGNTIRYDSKPVEPLTALMIPDYKELSDNDNVIMTGAEVQVYRMVVELIRVTDIRPEEIYNDGKDDSRPLPKKTQTVQ